MIIMSDNNRLIKLGNYKPSGYFCGNVYDPIGIAPTVMDSHGCTTAILINAEMYTFDEKLRIVKLLVEIRNERK